MTLALHCVPASRLSFTETCFAFCKDKPKEVTKVFKYSLEWLKLARPDSFQHGRTIEFLGDAKNALSVMGAPKEIHSLLTSKSLKDGVKNGCKVANTAYDTVELATKYVAAIPAGTVKAFKWGNATGTFVSSTISACEGGYGLVRSTSKGSPLVSVRGFQRMLQVARDVTFAVVGVFGMIMIKTGEAIINKKKMLIALTIGLTLSITEFFLTQMRNPEGKFTTFNQDKVVKHWGRDFNIHSS